jgi:hypothetical protein
MNDAIYYRDRSVLRVLTWHRVMLLDAGQALPMFGAWCCWLMLPVPSPLANRCQGHQRERTCNHQPPHHSLQLAWRHSK